MYVCVPAQKGEEANKQERDGAPPLYRVAAALKRPYSEKEEIESDAAGDD